MGLRFEHPEMLFWLLALPVVALLFWLARRAARRRLNRFAQSPSRLMRVVGGEWRFARAALWIVAMAFALTALARPQYGRKEREIERMGVDLFIAIDVSDSMLARDVDPTRLERARELLRGMIGKLKGDRVGVIVFAGAAFVQCPLTLDYSLAMRSLDLIGPGTVPEGGTALGDAVRLAMRNFEGEELGNKAIVLITDGEDQGSEPIAAAQEASDEGVVIHAIGLGTPSGAPVPEGGNLKRSEEGTIVQSRLDFEMLKSMVSVAGGAAVLAGESGFRSIDEIHDRLRDMEQRRLSEIQRERFIERYQWFLAPAVILFLVELALAEGRPVQRRRAESST